MLFKELSIILSHAPTLWCDNVSALALASNPVYHAHTKHIEVDYHFIRAKVVNGDILVNFISTLDQTAGIFTKGLSSTHFSALKSKLMATCEGMLVCIHQSLLRQVPTMQQSITLAAQQMCLAQITAPTKQSQSIRAKLLSL
jgi:hypothetical protein